MRDGRWIEHHPQQWLQQLADEAEQRVRRIVQGGFVERVRLRAAGSPDIHGYGTFSCGATELVEQLRLEAARIENRFEPSCRKLLDLLVRQLNAASLRDARADVAHDLFNIDAIGSFGSVALVGRWTLPALGSAPIRTAAAAVEMTAASLVVFHRHGISTF